MLARSIKAIIDGVDSTPSPPNLAQESFPLDQQTLEALGALHKADSEIW
jgi:hypothetical protein